MSKARIVIISILMLSLILVAASCRSANTKADNTTEQTPSSSVPATGDNTAANQSTSPAAAVKVFEFESKTYSDGGISIKYPQIKNYSDGVLQEKLNKIILDSAKRDLNTLMKDDKPSDYQIASTVTYNSTKLISIYFEGYSNFEGAAHPNQVLYAVTIDVNKLKTVHLKDLVKINEGFVKLLESGNIQSMSYDMTDEYRSNIQAYLKESSVENWITELSNADSSGYATASYLTKDGLAVSVTVPHVMGDHVEVLIPYRDLKDYKTNGPIWDVIN